MGKSFSNNICIGCSCCHALLDALGKTLSIQRVTPLECAKIFLGINLAMPPAAFLARKCHHRLKMQATSMKPFKNGLPPDAISLYTIVLLPEL